MKLSNAQFLARVAESADALALGASLSNKVGVQLPSLAFFYFFKKNTVK